MRCLYCGKELALLKRLTGNGEFCSDQHKQSYHDEYNRLALSRLLQAQTKTDEGRAKSAKSAGGTATPAEAPSTKRERGPALPVPVAHKAEPVATATAGFLPAPLAIVDCPHPAVISPSTPYSWIPSPVLPAFSQVQPLAIETAQEDPPVAGLLEFTMAPLRQTGLNPVQMSEAGPFESTHNVYPRREGTVKRESFDLGMAGPVAMPGISVVAPVAPELSLVDSQPFFPEVFQLLTPPPAQESPDLPAESAAVQVADGNLGLTEEAFELDHALPPEIEPPDIENVEKEHGKQPKLEEPDTSDAEGLGRLQTGLRSRPEPGRVGREWGGGRRTELPVVSGPVVDSLALQSLIPAPTRRDAAVRAKVHATAEGSVATLELTEVEPEEEAIEGEAIVVAEATAPLMEQLIPITLRIVAPAKARLVSESRPLTVVPEPLMGTAEILPLRPKMGMGKPPATPEASSASKPSSAVKVKQVRSLDEPGTAAVKAEPTEKPFDPREAVLAVKRSINVPENKTSTARRDEKPARTASKPAVPQPTRPTASTTEAPKAPEPEATPVAEAKKEARTGTTSQSASKESQPAAKPLPPTPAPPRVDPPGAAPTKVGMDTPTNFELHLGMPEKQSALSKLPLAAKIAMAVGLALAVGGAGYFVFAGSGTAKGTTSASSGLSVPSLLVGEDGWVTDWAGDTTGHHKGRKISVYRPSLNLTNYKIEFLGKIETNGVGWVFRAANASNFYAIKLAATGTGYRLLKYAVVGGNEKEMGQVPVRPVDGNTFPIRLEVRGDRFTTYIGTNLVDVWVDSQLKTGGVGFVNDRGDRAEITKVGISLLPASAN